MPMHPFLKPVTDEAIDAYTSYVKDRVSQGLPWKRAAEVLPTYISGEPYDQLVGNPDQSNGVVHV